MHTLSIAIVGHVDHGKSTLIGRLLHDVGGYPGLMHKEGRGGAAHLNSPLAHHLDHWEEERRDGITMDTAHAFFHGQRRRYVIIDTPGHKEFLRNTLTGCSQADGAVLLVDAAEGIKDQTRRHLFLLSLMGVKQIIVAINKMDLLDWSQERFHSLASQVGRLFQELGVQGRAFIVPVSAREGENIICPPEKMAWYHGPSLLDALDQMTFPPPEEKELRFPVQGLVKIRGEKIVMGKVESGLLHSGARLKFLPTKEMVSVRKAWREGEEGRDAFGPGECVGLTLEEDMVVSRGSVLTDNVQAQASDVVKATIFWMAREVGRQGNQFSFRCATQEVPGEITRVFWRFDPGYQDRCEKQDKEHLIGHGEVAEVEMILKRPVVVDPFHHIPSLGRFVLESNHQALAGGIVKERNLC